MFFSFLEDIVVGFNLSQNVLRPLLIFALEGKEMLKKMGIKCVIMLIFTTLLVAVVSTAAHSSQKPTLKYLQENPFASVTIGWHWNGSAMVFNQNERDLYISFKNPESCNRLNFLRKMERLMLQNRVTQDDITLQNVREQIPIEESFCTLKQQYL